MHQVKRAATSRPPMKQPTAAPAIAPASLGLLAEWLGVADIYAPVLEVEDVVVETLEGVLIVILEEAEDAVKVDITTRIVVVLTVCPGPSTTKLVDCDVLMMLIVDGTLTGVVRSVETTVLVNTDMSEVACKIALKHTLAQGLDGLTICILPRCKSDFQASTLGNFCRWGLLSLAVLQTYASHVSLACLGPVQPPFSHVHMQTKHRTVYV